MQTNFTPEQLKNPRIAQADEILRKCVHCGFCTATCSTYVLLGDERDSPRGRIYLIKDMFEQDKAASPEVGFHVDRCLSCLSCMTTCPGGVDYMHLVDLARVHIEETGKRSIKDRLTRAMLARVVPHAGRFRIALLGGNVRAALSRFVCHTRPQGTRRDAGTGAMATGASAPAKITRARGVTIRLPDA